MSPNQLRKDVMTLEMLDAKIKQCEEAERQRRLERDRQIKSAANRLGASALNRTVRTEETSTDNPNIVLGSD